MEEKVKKESKKLSYEELENAARQLTVQLDNMAKENYQLKMNLQQAKVANVYAELELRFKVLDYSTFFSEEFVEQCTKDIEQIMTPAPAEDNEEKAE